MENIFSESVTEIYNYSVEEFTQFVHILVYCISALIKIITPSFSVLINSIAMWIVCGIMFFWYLSRIVQTIFLIYVLYWLIVSGIDKMTGIVTKLRDNTGLSLKLKINHPARHYRFIFSYCMFGVNCIQGTVTNLIIRLCDSSAHSILKHLTDLVAQQRDLGILVADSKIGRFVNGVLGSVKGACKSAKPCAYLGIDKWDVHEEKKRLLIESTAVTLCKKIITARSVKYTLLSDTFEFTLLDKRNNKLVHQDKRNYLNKQYYIAASPQDTCVPLLITIGDKFNLSCKDPNVLVDELDYIFKKYYVYEPVKYLGFSVLKEKERFNVVSDLRDYLYGEAPESSRTNSAILEFLD